MEHSVPKYIREDKEDSCLLTRFARDKRVDAEELAGFYDCYSHDDR